MLADRYDEVGPAVFNWAVSRYGWLVYLMQEAGSGGSGSRSSGIVKPLASSFRGLVQSRNYLAASLQRLISVEGVVARKEAVEMNDLVWNPGLPPPIDRARICSRCPHALTCSLFRDPR